MAKLVKKIDIHVHTTPYRMVDRSGGGTFATPTELRSMYDQINVEKGVLLPEVAPECWSTGCDNETAAELARRYPETFAWFCNLDPRWVSNSPNSDFAPMLRYYKSKGAKGVGELTSLLPFDDPLVMNMMSHIEAEELPLIFHIGAAKYGEYGLVDDFGLPRLEKTLATFPKMRFLGHSQRFWAAISGDLTEDKWHGYPSGPVTPGGRVVELMRKYPNLCGDMSAGSGANAIMRDPEFGCAFIEEFQDRLYFGTDICDPRNITNPMLRLSGWLDDMVTQGAISQVAYEKVSRENALQIIEREFD